MREAFPNLFMGCLGKFSVYMEKYKCGSITMYPYTLVSLITWALMTSSGVFPNMTFELHVFYNHLWPDSFSPIRTLNKRMFPLIYSTVSVHLKYSYAFIMNKLIQFYGVYTLFINFAILILKHMRKCLTITDFDLNLF